MNNATYHNERIGENIFVIAGLRWKFVNVKNGDVVEEGVYSVDQDACFTLDSWKSYYGIQ